MLQRDYLLEVIGKFVATIRHYLLPALLGKDRVALDAAEDEIAELAGLGSEMGLDVTPDTLVMMMELSGVADSVASYAAWSLERASEAHRALGDVTTAELRHAQAVAIAEAFGWNLDATPEEFEELAQQLGLS